jgi:hypothetical protein
MAWQTSGSAAPDPIAYMDAAAGVARRVASDYKRRLADAMDLGEGQVVLDMGCWPGTDLAALPTRSA